MDLGPVTRTEVGPDLVELARHTFATPTRTQTGRARRGFAT